MCLTISRTSHLHLLGCMAVNRYKTRSFCRWSSRRMARGWSTGTRLDGDICPMAERKSSSGSPFSTGGPDPSKPKGRPGSNVHRALSFDKSLFTRPNEMRAWYLHPILQIREILFIHMLWIKYNFVFILAFNTQLRSPKSHLK